MVLRLAWRNLWRNARRTLLTVGAIGLGLAVLIWMVSLIEGMMEMMVEQVARSSIGHIQVAHPEYNTRKHVHLVVPEADGLVVRLEGLPNVQAVSPRLIFAGAIRSSQSSSMQVIQLKGVDPQRESVFSGLKDKVTDGGFVVPPAESLAADAPLRHRMRKGILLGDKLAQLLKVELGARVRVDTTGFQGETVSAAFHVTGIVDTGSDSFDRTLAMVRLDDLREAAHTGVVAHEVAVMLADAHQLEGSLAEVRQQVILAQQERGENERSSAMTWWDVVPSIKMMLDMSGAWNGILYLFMLVILSAGVLTTVFMMIYERRREFGIQMALGEGPGRLFVTVLAECVYIAVLSCLAGLAMGAAGAWWLMDYGIDLTWLLGGFDFAGLYIENVYRGSMTGKVFIEPTVVVFLSTVLFSLWPAAKVARMKALDAIRNGR
jgi:ABC-type lipoprotein release transport system permease subunit